MLAPNTSCDISGVPVSETNSAAPSAPTSPDDAVAVIELPMISVFAIVPPPSSSKADGPCAPMSAVVSIDAVVWFPSMVLFSMSSVASSAHSQNAASPASGPPFGAFTRESLSSKRVLRIVAVTPGPMNRPPPNAFAWSVSLVPTVVGYGCGIRVVSVTLLSRNTLLSDVNVEPWSSRTPPPSAKRPVGATAFTELPSIVVAEIASDAPASTATPAPSDWIPAA